MDSVVIQKARRLYHRTRLRAQTLLGRRRINLGSAGEHFPGWTWSDIEYLNILKRGDWLRYFAPGTVVGLLGEHVWEHLTREEGVIAARNCHEFLMPGGRLRVAVPDGFHPDPQYIEWVRPGGSGPGAHDHKILYNHGSFSSVFLEAGFKVELLEYWDDCGKFHAVEWSQDDGPVKRSKRFDPRNRDGRLVYTSVILDAKKEPPGAISQSESLSAAIEVLRDLKPK